MYDGIMCGRIIYQKKCSMEPFSITPHVTVINDQAAAGGVGSQFECAA